MANKYPVWIKKEMGWIEALQTEEDPAHFISESVLPQLTFSIARPKHGPWSMGDNFMLKAIRQDVFP